MKSLGRILAEARRKQNLTIGELHERTKISISVLRALEEGRELGLPAPIVRAFVRAVAVELGLDPLPLLNGLEENRVRQKEEPVTRTEPQKEWKSRKIIYAGAILFVLVFFVVFVVYRFVKGTSEQSESAESGLSKSIDTLSVNPFDLRVESLKDTWLEIRTAEKSESVFLAKGQGREWQEVSEISITLEEPTSIRLFCDGLPVGWDSLDTQATLFLKSGSRVRWEPAGIEKKVESEQKPRAPALITGSIKSDSLLRRLPIFARNKMQYAPDSIVISRLHALDPPFTIVVYFSSWDAISEVVVPRLLKILEQAELNNLSLNLIGLNRNLRDKAGLVDYYRIQGVPTILFLLRGQEIGRIAGHPSDRLENVVLAIADRQNRVKESHEITEPDSIHQDGRNGQ